MKKFKITIVIIIIAAFVIIHIIFYFNDYKTVSKNNKPVFVLPIPYFKTDIGPDSKTKLEFLQL